MFVIFWKLLDTLVWQAEFQDTILKLCIDIFRPQLVTNIKAAGAGASVAFLTDVTSILVFFAVIFIFCSLNREEAVLQVDFDIFLLKAGQVNGNLIILVRLFDISPHQVPCTLAKRAVPCKCMAHATIELVVPVWGKEIIEKIFAKEVRHHKSFLHFYSDG